nr:MAG TPA: hypothetical protein [Caudoviricetes sp.]
MLCTIRSPTDNNCVPSGAWALYASDGMIGIAADIKCSKKIIP